MFSFIQNNMSAIIKYFFALVIFLLIIELCTRIDDIIRYDAPFVGKYSSDRLRTVDDIGLPVNVPNSRFEKWENNKFGFRGPEITLEKPRGVIRCVCMGTSETYGLYEGPGREWPSRLNEILGPEGNYQVINSAIVGLRMDNYKEYLDTYVLKLKPDIVIILVNPYMYFAGMARNADRANTRQGQKTAVNSRSTVKEPFFVSRSYAKMLLLTKKTVKESLPVNWLKAYQVKIGLQQVKQAQLIRLKDKKPLDIVPQSYSDSFRNELKKLIIFIQDHGAKVVLSTYPALIDSNNVNNFYEIILDTQRFCAEFSIEGLINASSSANLAIMQTARESGIDVVDNYNVVPKTLEYFSDNVHYTDKGADAVAKNIARYITGSTH